MAHCDQINVMGIFLTLRISPHLKIYIIQFQCHKKTFRIHFHVHDALSLKGLLHDLKIWLKASFQNFLQFPNVHLSVKVQCSVYSHHKMKWIVFKSFVLDLGQSHKSGSGFITSVTCSWSLSHIHTHEAPPAWCCRHNIDVNLCLIQNLSLVIFPPS